jgi:hypothetical protein
MSMTVNIERHRIVAFLEYLQRKGLRSVFELVSMTKYTVSYRRKC